MKCLFLRDKQEKQKTSRQSCIHYSVADIMADTGCGKNKVLKAYLLAALFNTGATMSNYYRTEVNHEMPQFAG